MYHRVVDDQVDLSSNSYNQAGAAISRTKFIKQIKLLQKRYSIISLEEIVKCLQKEKTLPPNACALSFDDGYKDHYQNVFPILKVLKIPAIFFITGNCIAGTGKVRWLDKYYYIIDNTPLKGCNVKFQNNIPHEVNETDGFTLHSLKKNIRNSSNKEKDKIINDLAEILQVALDLDNLNKSLYLSEENILEMMNFGMNFGAHSMTHSDLGQLNFKEAKCEIVESGDIIRAITSKKEIAFAYPFGGPKTYNGKIIKVLRSNNFLCACTSIPGLNTETTPLFELRRIAGEKI